MKFQAHDKNFIEEFLLVLPNPFSAAMMSKTRPVAIEQMPLSPFLLLTSTHPKSQSTESAWQNPEHKESSSCQRVLQRYCLSECPGSTAQEDMLGGE